TEPKAAFSACYGAPFMIRQASVYANILARKMQEKNVRCVLLNTGWSGGPYGEGKRISIKHTRSLLNAALRGDLHRPDMTYETHPVFNLKVPTECPDVPADILDPRNTWPDKSAYDRQAEHLRELFRKNFADKGLADMGITAVL